MSYIRIGLLLDGSPIAEEAIPIAVRLTHQLGSRLMLIRIIELSLPESNQLTWEAELFNPARLYLQDLSHNIVAEALQEPHLRADQLEIKFGCGKPADEILRLVKTEKIDLLVMTTHGLGGIFQLLLGSMTTDILQNSNVPVVLVRAHHQGEKSVQPGQSGPLVVTLDGTSKAEAVLEPAIELARCLGVSVALLRVVSPFIPVDALSTWYLRNLDKEPGKMHKSAFNFLLAQADQYLEKMQEWVCRQGVDCQKVIRVGETAHEIQVYINETQASMLAMAAHARGRLDQIWLGSVAGEIMQHINQPVLLVNNATYIAKIFCSQEVIGVN